MKLSFIIFSFVIVISLLKISSVPSVKVSSVIEKVPKKIIQAEVDPLSIITQSRLKQQPQNINKQALSKQLPKLPQVDEIIEVREDDMLDYSLGQQEDLYSDVGEEGYGELSYLDVTISKVKPSNSSTLNNEYEYEYEYEYEDLYSESGGMGSGTESLY